MEVLWLSLYFFIFFTFYQKRLYIFHEKVYNISVESVSTLPRLLKQP
ncbi:hypothetical protein HMPREF9182_1721 [Streptococcus sp. oral taxon 056 str. F0418]|nr:hypothetical protein HMPREF9182_1721 [Streptococcus sp. oral taxon 056 str. F0418]